MAPGAGTLKRVTLALRSSSWTDFFSFSAISIQGYSSGLGILLSRIEPFSIRPIQDQPLDYERMGCPFFPFPDREIFSRTGPLAN
jgi:hypothetical protein